MGWYRVQHGQSTTLSADWFLSECGSRGLENDRAAAASCLSIFRLRPNETQECVEGLAGCHQWTSRFGHREGHHVLRIWSEGLSTCQVMICIILIYIYTYILYILHLCSINTTSGMESDTNIFELCGYVRKQAGVRQRLRRRTRGEQRWDAQTTTKGIRRQQYLLNMRNFLLCRPFNSRTLGDVFFGG